MNKLPAGWAETTFDDVLDYVQRGKSPKYAEESALPVINQKCVRWWGIQEEFLKFIRADQIDAYTEERFLREGDILWNSTGTGTIGRAALYQGLSTSPKAVVDGHVTILRSSKAIEPRYLFSFIKSPRVQDKIEDMQSGSTNQVELSKTEVLKTEIPLPPLAEQKRIVSKIDCLSDRTTTARTHLTTIAKLVERYKEAILWCVFKEIGDIYPKKPLASICLSITDGDHQAPPKASEGIPFITISALNKGWIDLAKATRFVPDSYYNELKPERRPQYGDILYSVTGSIGIPAPVIGDEKFVFQRHIAILRPDIKKASQNYLLYALQSLQVKQQGLDCATGIAQLTIPLKGLRTFVVPTPPVDKQHKIVRQIETAFAKIDNLAAEVERALKLTDRLEQRILAKAFAGELVQQDPNDEPASDLLERIRNERAKNPKSRSSAKRGVKFKKSSTSNGTKKMSGRKRADVAEKHLSETLKSLGGIAEPRDLWQKSEMDLNEFYKLLRDEVGAGRIIESDNKEKLELSNAA